MHVLLTNTQRMFQESVRTFAERHLRDGALARAHSSDYPWDVAQLMAENDLIGITLDSESGGIGSTLMDAVLAIEQVAAVCPLSADVVQAGNFGAIRVLDHYGTADQKHRLQQSLRPSTRLHEQP